MNSLLRLISHADSGLEIEIPGAEPVLPGQHRDLIMDLSARDFTVRDSHAQRDLSVTIQWRPPEIQVQGSAGIWVAVRQSQDQPDHFPVLVTGDVLTISPHDPETFICVLDRDPRLP